MEDREINNQCLKLYREKKYREAIECFDKALEKVPDSESLWNNKAFAHRELKELPQAEEAFRKVVGINPGSARGWAHLGIILYLRNKTEEMRECFGKVLQIAASKEQIQTEDEVSAITLALHYSAKSFFQKGEYDRAIKLFDLLLNNSPNEKEALFFKGLALLNKEDYESARKCYERLVAIEPNSSRCWNNLGMAYEHLEELQLAREAYEKAIDLDPENKSPHLNLHNIFEDLTSEPLETTKEFQHVRQDIQESLRSHDLNPKGLGGEWLNTLATAEYCYSEFITDSKEDFNFFDFTTITIGYYKTIEIMTRELIKKRKDDIGKQIDSFCEANTHERDNKEDLRIPRNEWTVRMNNESPIVDNKKEFNFWKVASDIKRYKNNPVHVFNLQTYCIVLFIYHLPSMDELKFNMFKKILAISALRKGPAHTALEKKQIAEDVRRTMWGNKNDVPQLIQEILTEI